MTENENDGGADAPTEGPASVRWPQALVDALTADRRVVGAAEVPSAAGRAAAEAARRAAGGAAAQPATDGVLRIIVATTYDGLDALAAELPRLGALALGAEPAAAVRNGARWTGLTADLRRAEIELVRIGDLRPSARGEAAEPVVDPKGLIDQWARWSRGRDREREAERRRAAVTGDEGAAAGALQIDEAIRQFAAIPSGTRVVGRGAPWPARPKMAWALRQHRAELTPATTSSATAGATAAAATSPAGLAAALAARIDAVLAATPQTGEGLRVVPGERSPEETLEDFLRVADGEGFLGDRMLFAEAVKRLTELSRRAPVFDEGFVLPTFDAVEARWRIGEATGGCKTPLVPGVYVGVGVTPADELEFWAAPFVREPLATVACVADSGARVVRARTVGRDALVAACVGEVERAWDELPDFLRAARQAARTPAGDVEAALRPLHLPRSYREAARRMIGRLLTPSRLQVALALARAGDDQEPLNARKFGLAAGRFLGLGGAAPD